MAKYVVRYLLEGVGTIPTSIADGGYWPVDHELVGVSVDDTLRYIPSTLIKMAKADLVARLAGMNMVDRDTNLPLDSNAQLVMLNAWLDMVGMSDLA